MSKIISSVTKKDYYKNKEILYAINIYGKMYFLCPECNTLEPFEIEKDEYGMLKRYEDLEYHYGNCVYEFKNKFNYCLTCNKQFDHDKYLLIICDTYCDSTIPKSIIAFDNEDDTINIKFNFSHIRVTKNYKFQKFFVTQRIKINCKTGQSYIFEPWINNKRAFYFTGPKISNCNYGIQLPLQILYIPDFFYDTIFKYIYKLKSKYFNFKLNTIDEYKNENKDKNKLFTARDARIEKIKNFSEILIYNRLPNYNTKTMQYYNNNCYKDIVTKTISKVKTNSTNPIKEILDILKLPNSKSLKNICNNDLNQIVNISYINKAFNDIKYSINLSKKFIYSNMNMAGVYFMRQLIKERGIKKAYITLMNAKYFFNDTAEMYARIKKHNTANKRNKKIKIELKGNLKEIHDNLTLSINKIKTKNVYFKYNKKDREKIKYEEKDFKIELTKSTHQLQDIGTRMHICVGSYDQSVLNKNCRIAIMTNLKKEFITCIELDYDLKKVNQTKMSCNSRPTGEVKEVLLNWIKNKDLEINTSDMKECYEVQCS